MSSQPGSQKEIDFMTEFRNELRIKNKVSALRRRFTELIGLAILIGGYALLAVDPETPSEWVLFRVFGGFTALIVGFGVAILPLLTRITGGDD